MYDIFVCLALEAGFEAFLSSFPTKHQRAVKTHQEKKGFLSQAQRFPLQASLSENPGPASYACVPSAEIQSPSFSQKGTTGFVMPKTLRPSSYPKKDIPGPNAYNLQSSFINKCDFNKGVSRVFRPPLVLKVDGPKHPTPAPNQYDIRYCRRENFSSLDGTSTFLSKTTRDTFYPNVDGPSPCHYKVNTSEIHNSPKAVSSPFRSKTKRIPAPVKKGGPGPGAYSPYQPPAPVKRTILRYGTIACPPLILPKDPPFPGPGHYDIDDHRDLSKHPVPTAAFASKTERTFQNFKANTNPGPGFYNPQILSKQSFIYRDPNVWIPV
ncbi:O(6)-methylguanine-induced apoptosis 2 [Halichoeres trimaculatus]|uniref:O(6)-methylguanine-induced apoptosis 2 n=1 Tax=Halichoeres trimaculatus TaxID=147232 RepID=UPI003D9E96F0